MSNRTDADMLKVETPETREAFKRAWLALEDKEEKDLERAEGEWSAAAAKVAPELLVATEIPHSMDDEEGIVVEEVVVYEEGYGPEDDEVEMTEDEKLAAAAEQEARVKAVEEQQQMNRQQLQQQIKQYQEERAGTISTAKDEEPVDVDDDDDELCDIPQEPYVPEQDVSSLSLAERAKFPTSSSTSDSSAGSGGAMGKFGEKKEHSFTRFVVRSSSMDMVDEPDYKGAHVGSTVTMETVRDIIEAARKNIPLHRKYVSRILLQTKKYLQRASKVVMDVTVPNDGRLIIVGDTHGQFIDLLTIFDKYGLPSEKNVYVFNGDYVDRGPHGVVILLVLYAILLANPMAIYLNRGNHEQRHMNERYSFMEEVVTQYSSIEFELFVATFKYLPLVTIINNSAVVVHGGIPPYSNFDIRTMTDLDFIDPNESNEDYAETFDYILWSDPGKNNGCYPNRRGAGIEWGPDHTQNFLRANNFSLIIRSHEVKDEGYEYTHAGKVLTVFSASVYCGANDNKGAVAIYDSAKHILPPEKPIVENYYAIATSNTSDVCRQKTMDIIRRDFFLFRHRLIDEFEQEDKEGEGYVTVEQFENVMQRVIDCPLQWDVLWPYFATTDYNGKINYSEWLSEYRMTLNDSFLAEWVEDVASQVCKKMIKQHGDLQKSFSMIDTDGSRDISYQEFSTALRSYNLGLADENIFDLFQSLDTSQNGRIDFEEFADRFARLFHKLRYSIIPQEWCEKQVLLINKLFIERYGSIEDAFIALDESQAGRISDTVLAKVMKEEFHIEYDTEQVDSLVYHINCSIELMASSQFSYAGFNQAVENALAEEDENKKEEESDDEGGVLGNKFYSSLLNSIARTFQIHSVQLKRFFRRMDVDFNNQLSIHEFRVGMRVMNELLVTPLTDSQIEKLYHIIDVNGDGGISYNEFMQAFTPTNW